MSEQERLKANQIQYEQEDALRALRAENAQLWRAVNELVGCFIEGGKPNLAEIKAALQPVRDSHD